MLNSDCKGSTLKLFGLYKTLNLANKSEFVNIYLQKEGQHPIRRWTCSYKLSSPTEWGFQAKVAQHWKWFSLWSKGIVPAECSHEGDSESTSAEIKISRPPPRFDTTKILIGQRWICSLVSHPEFVGVLSISLQFYYKTFVSWKTQPIKRWCWIKNNRENRNCLRRNKKVISWKRIKTKWRGIEIPKKKRKLQFYSNKHCFRLIFFVLSFY